MTVEHGKKARLAEARAPFQVLVMSEESRLGRESIEAAYALKQLVQAGVPCSSTSKILEMCGVPNR